MDRENRLARTFVELADTLVDDYDVNEFLQLLTIRCADLVDASAVGVLLIDTRGELRLVAASTDDMRALELFEIQQRQGPCFEAFSSRDQVREDDLRTATERWPEFAKLALEQNFRSVHAFPLRLRDQGLGALNVFFSRPGSFAEDDVLALQALADVAAIGILQQRNVQESADVAQHLQTALDSRVVIEQAVGVLVERRGVRTGEAFELIRGHSRSNNLRLRAVAEAIVAGAMPADALDGLTVGES